MPRNKRSKTEVFQRQQGKYTEHCCVPLCSASARYNAVLSFHNFPTDPDRRRQWLVNIRRDHFTITSHTKVCSRHFTSDQLVEPATLGGRRMLAKDAVPRLFEWNSYVLETPRLSVWERTTRPIEPEQQEEQQQPYTGDHDYCSVPEPAALDMAVSAVEDMAKEIEDLRRQVAELRVQREFGLQRFAGSDADIRFYTRFPSYDHLMAFWFLIEPSIHKMVRVTRAKSDAKMNEVVTHGRHSTRQQLEPIDEFFLFLLFLAAGLKERDLAHRFNIHQSTVSRILATWTCFLATALGSVCIWLKPAEVQAHLPEVFKDFSDTQVGLDNMAKIYIARYFFICQYNYTAH